MRGEQNCQKSLWQVRIHLRISNRNALLYIQIFGLWVGAMDVGAACVGASRFSRADAYQELIFGRSQFRGESIG